MTTEIEDKLLEITKSLSKIDSARKQVDDVTSVSKEIVSQNAELSKLFGDLYTHIKGYSSNIGQLLTSNQDSLQSSLLQSITNWENKIDLHINEIVNRNSKLENDLNAIYSKHKFKLDESTKVVDESVRKFRDELKNVQKEVEVLRMNVSSISLDPIISRLNEIEEKTIKSIDNKRRVTVVGFTVVIILLIIIIAKF